MISEPICPLGPVVVDVGGLVLDDEDIQHLQHPMTGAVILFSKNFKNKQQITELISEIKNIRRPELLVCVDQEGGRVQRFTGGFTRLPAAGRIGDIYDGSRRDGTLSAAAAGYLMAAELAETGLDFSFAPVLDVSSCTSDVIGDRSFHASANIVTELASAYIDGMADAGMAATGKHFPGHGGVEADSHVDLPGDGRSIQEVSACDMVPFHDLVHELGGVMTAHVLFEHINAEIPTFSRYWLQEELRGRLGYEGVIFSDDLSMEGAKQGDIVSCGVRALDAGCDMVLVCNAPDSASELLDGLQQHGEYGRSGEKLTAHLGRMRRRKVPLNRVEKARELLLALGLIPDP